MSNRAVISSIQRFSTGDGPGIRTTVFFQGCNLSCEWCHNPETIPREPVLLYHKNRCLHCGQCAAACLHKAHAYIDSEHTFKRTLCTGLGECVNVCPAEALQLSGRIMELEQVLAVICEDVEFYDASGGGVTLSGGEPLLQADFCALLAQKCIIKGIPVLIDTAGNVAYATFQKLLPYKPQIYLDIKAESEQEYKERVGGSFDIVISNLARLVADQADVTARIPIIPRISDTLAYCERLRDVLMTTGVKQLHLLPFHRLGSGKYVALGKDYSYKDVQAPTQQRMHELLAVFVSDFDVKIDG